jgi:hypothetical protein
MTRLLSLRRRRYLLYNKFSLSAAFTSRLRKAPAGNRYPAHQRHAVTPSRTGQSGEAIDTAPARTDNNSVSLYLTILIA